LQVKYSFELRDFLLLRRQLGPLRRPLIFNRSCSIFSSFPSSSVLAFASLTVNAAARPILPSSLSVSDYRQRPPPPIVAPTAPL
jgi:hypothetical protein